MAWVIKLILMMFHLVVSSPIIMLLDVFMALSVAPDRGGGGGHLRGGNGIGR